MNQDTPRNTDTTETDDARMTSRRDLLAAGAAAVVGATALSSTSSQVAAAGTGQAPGPGVWEVQIDLGAGTAKLVRVPDAHFGADPDLANTLVKIILAVWDDSSHKTDLMSTDYGTVRAKLVQLSNLHGNGGSPPPPAQAHSDKRISLNKPRVISQAMYNNGYVKASVEEIVFVLPDPPGTDNSTGTTGGSVRALMAAVPFGM